MQNKKLFYVVGGLVDFQALNRMHASVLTQSVLPAHL